MQWLLQWRSSQQQNPAFDACIAATALGVADLVASCGLRALRTPGLKAVLACIAHSASAALIMQGLLASRHCRDAPGAILPSLIFSCAAHQQWLNTSAHQSVRALIAARQLNGGVIFLLCTSGNPCIVRLCDVPADPWRPTLILMRAHSFWRCSILLPHRAAKEGHMLQSFRG